MLACWIGFDAQVVFGVKIGIGRRPVEAATFDIELPAVIDAAVSAPFIAPEPEVGAAMRAVLVVDSDPAARVAEAEQRARPSR